MDMRGEEEAALQPHSQVRHELMHDQYNRMKEDDDHWQDVSVSVFSRRRVFLRHSPQRCRAEPPLAPFPPPNSTSPNVSACQDLARWKNRRKSISQDLIKKEEERKMMEQLMTGGTCTSQRRRSIKTYREIVEEK